MKYYVVIEGVYMDDLVEIFLYEKYFPPKATEVYLQIPTQSSTHDLKQNKVWYANFL